MHCQNHTIKEPHPKAPFPLNPAMVPLLDRIKKEKLNILHLQPWEKPQPPWQHPPLQPQIWIMKISQEALFMFLTINLPAPHSPIAMGMVQPQKQELDIISISDFNTQGTQKKSLELYPQKQRPIPHHQTSLGLAVSKLSHLSGFLFPRRKDNGDKKREGMNNLWSRGSTWCTFEMM